MPNYCPKECNGAQLAQMVPLKLTPKLVEEVKRAISRNKKYAQLPDLESGEDFYFCCWCHVIWKATSERSTDAARVPLGRMISGDTRLPFQGNRQGWA